MPCTAYSVVFMLAFSVGSYAIVPPGGIKYKRRSGRGKPPPGPRRSSQSTAWVNPSVVAVVASMVGSGVHEHRRPGGDVGGVTLEHGRLPEPLDRHVDAHGELPRCDGQGQEKRHGRHLVPGAEEGGGGGGEQERRTDHAEGRDP